MDYLVLNVRLSKWLHTPITFDPKFDIDAQLGNERQKLYEYLQENQIPNEVLELIFVREYIAKHQLNDNAYCAFLNMNRNNEVLDLIAKTLLDYQIIESILRRKQLLIYHLKGTISSEDVAVYGLSRTLFKSFYFKEFEKINIDNYRKCFDEWLYHIMVPYSFSGIGIDSIIAKTVMILLQMDNQRIIQKAQQLSINADHIVRRYHD